MMSVVLLTGCSGYYPIVIGPGYLGIGAYRDHGKMLKGGSTHIDLNGIGFLLLDDRAVIGYSQIARVYCNELPENIRINLSHAEIGFGEAADVMALEMLEQWNQ